MALTNYNKLTTEELTIWSRDIWKVARNNSFMGRFMGDGIGSMIQRIKELTKSDKGARAVITLVADLEGDGVAGDRSLEGNEEEGRAFDQVIRIDQMRHAQRHEGRISDQKSIVNFRTTMRDVLGYWMGDRMDQLAFLTMSGVSYALKTNGAARIGSDFINLEFAADVTVPTANRHRRWDAGTSSLLPGDTTAVVAADTPSWAMLVEAKAFAKDNFIRPLRGDTGESSSLLGDEMYAVFMTPQGIAKLKQDPDFLAAWRLAQQRGATNPIFKGASTIMIDGLAIYEYRHVFNTRGATSGSKFGAAGTVEGQRILFCGAQAMAFADIGMPIWVEKDFDYDNSPGLSISKIMGMKKPVFRSEVTGTDEDFGLFALDTAI